MWFPLSVFCNLLIKASSPAAGLRHAGPRPMTSVFGPKKGNGGYRGEQGELAYILDWKWGKSRKWLQLWSWNSTGSVLQAWGRVSQPGSHPLTSIFSLPSLSTLKPNMHVVRCWWGQFLACAIPKMVCGWPLGDKELAQARSTPVCQWAGAQAAGCSDPAETLPRRSGTRTGDLEYKANAWWCLRCWNSQENHQSRVHVV